jgi:hypothetical protein
MPTSQIPEKEPDLSKIPNTGKTPPLTLLQTYTQTKKKLSKK